ncbi:MAG: ABC transporter permease subunit [Actinomycetota bacterium]|nr:ABC transporter permease subunit [Actinomycetota bacterium]
MSRDRLVHGVVLPAVGIIAVFVLWELGARNWDRLAVFPPATDVAAEVVDQLRGADVWIALGHSAVRWLAGLGAAIAIGVPLGLLMGRIGWLFRAVDPILTVLYPVPKAALILLLVLLWGANDRSRITVIALGSLIPVVISAYHGARAIDPKLLWSASSLGHGRARSMVTVVAPAALGQILSGLRLAIGISIFVLVGAELLVRDTGIGAYLYGFYDVGLDEEVWAVTAIIAIVGWAIDALYVRSVLRFVPWFEGDV